MDRPRGTCSDCGQPTWSRKATRCRACYDDVLRARKGPANPMWDRVASDAPQAGRDRATRRFDLGTCERCQEKPAVERHHRDGDTQNNAPENVECVCRRCHMEADGRLEALKTRMRRPRRWERDPRGRFKRATSP